ncbi:condensation domain-containing protein [Nocardia takedensis]|uniref:condensation domain-containing protein n=1 Tax=Nocardia takedensis TaxID=259390 RepID=UPI003F769CEE
MDAALHVGTFRDMLWMWHARHEGLRTTVVLDSDPRLPICRLTCDAINVDIVDEDSTDRDDATELNRHLCEIMESDLSPLVWPHLLVATVEHRDGAGFTILVGADHSVMDAYSQLLVITELHTADYAVLERRSAAQLTTDSPAVEIWRDFLARSGGLFPRFPVPIATSSTATPAAQTSISQWLLSDEEAYAAEQFAADLGFRPPVAIFAALTLAARTVTGSTVFRTIMPLATRPTTRFSASVGWFVNIAPLEVEVSADADFPDALVAAHTALSRAKPTMTQPAARIMELLGTTDYPRFAISFVDLRCLPDAEPIAGLNGRTLRADSYADDEIYFWVGRMSRGLNISSRFPATWPVTMVQRFIYAFTEVLREAAHRTTGLRAVAVVPEPGKGVA